MKSLKPEITNISPHGFWIYLQGKEYFLPFEKYPWFKDATIKDINNLKLLHKTHLHWPTLDIDLSISILEEPDKFKLIYK